MSKDKQSGVDSPLVRVLRTMAHALYGETLPLGLEQDLDKISAPPKTRFVPPTIEEVEEYYRNRPEILSAKQAADKFWNFYNSKDWMVGKSKMKSWQSAAANAIAWEGILKKERGLKR